MVPSWERYRRANSAGRVRERILKVIAPPQLIQLGNPKSKSDVTGFIRAFDEIPVRIERFGRHQPSALQPALRLHPTILEREETRHVAHVFESGKN